MARGRSNVSSANVDADLAAFNDELDGLGNEALPLLHDSGSSGLPPSNEPTMSGSSLPTGQARTASSAGLEERANLIKRHCTLSAEAKGKLDLLVEVCAVYSPVNTVPKSHSSLALVSKLLLFFSVVMSSRLLTFYLPSVVITWRTGSYLASQR